MNVLMELLVSALDDRERREHYVRQFQELVWDSPDFPDGERHAAMLVSLADEMENYVPDPTKRAESIAYFGDNELEAKIVEALEQLCKDGVQRRPEPLRDYPR